MDIVACDIAQRRADESDARIFARSIIFLQNVLNRRDDNYAVIILWKFIGLYNIMGGLMQIYASIAAGDVIFAEVIVIRGLEHDTIIIVSQMIAGEIIIIAVLQQNALRTIINVIHPKVIALG